MYKIYVAAGKLIYPINTPDTDITGGPALKLIYGHKLQAGWVKKKVDRLDYAIVIIRK